MDHKKWFFLTLMTLLAACNDESQQPELDLTGHWNIDHEFYEPCQINATFTDELLILTFFSLEEGACQPERYGIQNNALTIRIDDKQDYLKEDDTLATTLQVSVSEHQAMGTLMLWETEQGLTGDIASASDPNNLLEPLLQPLYQLTPLSDHWLPFALGRWGVSCDQLEFPEYADQMCELIEITNTTSGRLKSYGGSASNGPNGERSEIRSTWHDVTFALQNLVVSGHNAYELDLVIFGDIPILEVMPLKLKLTLVDGRLMLEVDEGGGVGKSLELLRMD